MLYEINNRSNSTENKLLIKQPTCQNDAYELNHKLFEENQSLRKQYDDAISAYKNVEDIKSEMVKVSKELNSEKLRNDDLLHRLDISFHKNQELQKEIENFYSINNQKENEILTLQETLKSVQESQKENEKQNEIEISQLIQKYEDEKRANIDQLQSISEILNASNQYFHSNFKSILSLKDFFTSQRTNHYCDKEHSMTTDNQKNDFQPLEERYKQQLKDLRACIKKYKKQCHELHQQLELQIEMKDNVIRDLNIKMQSIENDLEEVKKNYENDISDRESKIDVLSHDLAQAKETIQKMKEVQNNQLNDNQSSLELSKNSFSKTENNALIIQQHENTIITLKQQIIVLHSKLRDSLKDQEKIQQKAITSEHKKMFFESLVKQFENEKLTRDNELNNQNIKLESTLQELTKTKKLLIQKDNELSNQNFQNQKLIQSITLLQDTISNQKDEILKIYKDREKIINLFNAFLIVISKIEKEMLNRQSKEQSHLDQINLLTQKIDELKIDKEKKIEDHKKDEDLFSYTYFLSLNLPKEILVEIDQIPKCSKLSSIKPQKIIELILKYYKLKFEEKNEEFLNLQNIIQEKDKAMYSLVTEICCPLNVEPSDVIEGKINITEKVFEFCNRIKIAQNSQEQMEKNILSLLMLLKSNSVTEGISSCQRLIQKIKTLKSKNNNENYQIRKKIRKYEETIRELNKQNENNKQKIEFIQNQLEKAQQQLDQYNKNNILIKEENDKLKSEKLKILQKFEESQIRNQSLQQPEKENQSSTVSLNPKNEEKLKEVQKERDKYNKEATQWKNIALKLQKEKNTMNCKMNNLTQQLKINHSFLEKRQELDDIKNNQENEIKTNLLLKIRDLERLIKETTLSLESSEKERMSQKSIIEILNEQNKNKIQSLLEEQTRERILYETRIKSLQLSNELELQKKIQTISSNFDSEEREFLAFIADTFRENYNANIQLSKVSIKELINNVKKKFCALLIEDQNIRKSLKISSNESIEESVRKLIKILETLKSED